MEYSHYYEDLGIKGDTGDPGARGPRGLVGVLNNNLHLRNLLTTLKYIAT